MNQQTPGIHDPIGRQFDELRSQIALLQGSISHLQAQVTGNAAALALRVQALELRPGDILVAKVPGTLTMEQYRSIGEMLRQVMPDARVLLIDDARTSVTS